MLPGLLFLHCLEYIGTPSENFYGKCAFTSYPLGG